MFRQQALGEIHALFQLGDPILHRVEVLTQLVDLAVRR